MRLSEYRSDNDPITELKNRSTTGLNLAYQTRKTLGELMALEGVDAAKGALALYELHQKAKNPEYAILAHFVPLLEEYGFIEPNGGLDNDVCNVILSSIEGEGAKIHLIPPVPFSATLKTRNSETDVGKS